MALAPNKKNKNKILANKNKTIQWEVPHTWAHMTGGRTTQLNFQKNLQAKVDFISQIVYALWILIFVPKRWIPRTILGKKLNTLYVEFEKIPILFTWKAEFDVIAAVNVLNQLVDLSTVAYSERRIFILNLKFHFSCSSQKKLGTFKRRWGF
jgi:hypothetical protein